MYGLMAKMLSCIVRFQERKIPYNFYLNVEGCLMVWKICQRWQRKQEKPELSNFHLDCCKEDELTIFLLRHFQVFLRYSNFERV